MEKLTAKWAEDYIRDNYGSPKHDIKLLVKACKRTASIYDVRSVEVFLLLIENKEFTGTHFLGYLTPYGSEIAETVKEYYTNSLLH